MAMPSMTPVIRRCLSGEQQAQEELVLAAQNRVYYHCKKMLKHEEDALDATQEILIPMLTRLDRLQDPEAFWGWLSAMTANHCRNVLTRGHREAQIPEDDEGNSLLDAFENLDEQSVPDKALDNDETRRMIVDLVDQLPPPQRQCVLMFYYEEMSVRDIAAALETSEGTIKSRLNYARKAIKAGVDAYAAQGIKLYSAVPFLVYFLQKDALSGGLSASAAEALAHTVLAGAAGTAAVGTAAAGTAAGAAGSSGGAAAGTAAAAAETAAGGAAASAGSAAAASSGAASHALGACWPTRRRWDWRDWQWWAPWPAAQPSTNRSRNRWRKPPPSWRRWSRSPFRSPLWSRSLSQSLSRNRRQIRSLSLCRNRSRNRRQRPSRSPNQSLSRLWSPSLSPPLRFG